MATASVELIKALRDTSKRIGGNKSNYDWKNIGACNCGNLVQIVTGHDKKQIHQHGIQKHGDWEMLVYLYNDNGKYEIDRIIKTLLDLGFTLDDIVNLENLSDPEILSSVPGNKRFLKRDAREDVILYLETWANLLEDSILSKITFENQDLDSVMA